MNHRRRKLLIDRPVQGAIARRITLHWILFFFILFFTLPLWRLCYRTDLSAPFSTLLLQGWAETAPIFVLLLAILPMFIWDTVKLSHRFAGPMYRFQKALKELAAGDEPRPIRLRKGDFWTDVADDFNAMLEQLAREEGEERRLAVEETDLAMSAPACAQSEP